MKIIDILKKAEEIENKYIILREPTRKTYGYAIKLTGDPMFKLCEIDFKRGGEVNNKYKIECSFRFSISIADQLIEALKELQKMEL